MDYSTVGGSLFVCLMGMGTVFFGLICLIALTTLMGKLIPAAPKTEKTAAISAAPAQQAVASSSAPDTSLIAAISAAIAEDLHRDITGIRIVSLRRV